ncbi:MULTISPECIES: 30S ribosomal protein S1 [Psychrobacter]|jgi:small subunit ribosomal protein S1|uniref:30S ribosomal protein S1 n=3 Tax=Psychrobacter TaxID=497 RepID=A0A6N7BY54_9GAMM|nr:MULTISPECIES: 30S ribosomal protein S1 [Psychrobacter]KAF0567972.1 SSU ribosomal protein S1p [Psychrobacter nivimaris]KRG36416.1 30S ribosomal protein S1 [Psychrobacter sp. P11G3]MBA6243858.1 30S ribosomal protein S1 [Psychrobacter sp. Urea-trap-18]MBA6285441.1 30S ribosomal protein S1 [Psychrobacter sp. Urea-trap-16]MBA6319039.1 30S ribosomal protein S1 [Psychrobacter sp. Urea-trap-20]|tara:strand:- start:16 stop:1704 length:1689 start_codon:yes stop_codon:yes gene_type:complete
MESFAELFEASIEEQGLDIERGSVITGAVVAIDSDWITVDTGLKSEGIVAREEFLSEEGELEVEVGDSVDVVVEAVDNGMGQTLLSREKAKRVETWNFLEKIADNDEIVKGIISSKVKGGFTVDIGSVRAFLPGSLVDVRPIRDTTHLEGKELEFKVIKLDQKRNNVVVSRRAVMEAENSAEREELLNKLEEGIEIEGIVKNLTDYGAFVDLGGIDGLLHITDMAWRRIKHPSEVVEVGQDLKVKVLKFDRERNRVSLGLKQLGTDPWDNVGGTYPVGSVVKARVTNLTDYGCFAEISEGIEGLVHVSEMDHTNKNIHPSKVVQVGDEVEVMILDIDEERRRISLGIKQTLANPWDEFDKKHERGDKITGTIKSITDFGIFIGLDGGIDGLVHLSDISWNETGEDAIRNYNKGDTVEAMVLSVDAEANRISLGVKQLSSDPFNEYLVNNDRGAIVNGKVKEVDAKGATIELADEVEAYLRASEIQRDRVEDATKHLTVGDDVEAKIISVDRKTRNINLSIKAKDEAEERQAIKDLGSTNTTAAPGSDAQPKTIGDLIKEQMQ